MSTSTETQTDKLSRFMARQEILEVLARYARGVDRADGELLLSCYHEGAIEEHGSTYCGPAREYVEGAVERLKLMGPLAHYLCSTHVEFDGDVAWAETYVLTFARVGEGEASTDTFTGGRLHDKFECRGGEWKITHRRMAFDWNRDMDTREDWCAGLFDPSHPKFHLGVKGFADLSYQRD